METRTRKPALERREEIVAAVLRIIGNRGVTALTTATLAEEVGVTSGALFRHYASLDDIFHDVVRYAVDRIQGTFPDASLPPVARIIELARNRVRVFGADPGLAWLLRSDQACLFVPPAAADQLRKLVQKSRRYVLSALRQGATERSVRTDIDPEVLVVPVMGTIHALIGMPGAHRLGAGKRDHDRVLVALERMLAPPSSENATRSEAKSPTMRKSSRRR